MCLIRSFCRTAAVVNNSMKIVQFRVTGDCKIRIGILNNDKVIDVNSCDNDIPNSLVQFLYNDDALDKLKGYFSHCFFLFSMY